VAGKEQGGPQILGKLGIESKKRERGGGGEPGERTRRGGTELLERQFYSKKKKKRDAHVRRKWKKKYRSKVETSEKKMSATGEQARKQTGKGKEVERRKKTAEG